MAGGYRCTLGHTWNPPIGVAVTACPLCGTTAFVAVALEEVPVIAGAAADPETSEHLSRVEVGTGLDHAPTLEFSPPKPTDTPDPDPSFSSLAVMLSESVSGTRE